MGRTSVIFPGQPGTPSEVEPYADLVKRGLAARLWMGQSLRVETHHVIAHLAANGYRVPTGVSVTLMPLRHPVEAAVQARSLALLTGHPVVAGFGTSTPELVTRLTGAPYRRPATVAGDYLSAVRTLLDGGDLRGFTLPPLRHPPVEVGAGVLRPGMAKVAGAYADVAITWMTPPDYVADVVSPALRDGAPGARSNAAVPKAAGSAARDRVPPRIATVVHAAVERPGRSAARLAYLAARTHLSSAHYTDMLRRAGLDVDPADPVGGAAALADAGVFAFGTAEEVARRLLGYRRAGVDEIIVNTAGVLFAEGPRAAIDDAEEILHALGEHGEHID